METAHDLYDRAEDAAAYIKHHVSELPETAVILGTGLGDAAALIAEPTRISYSDIPNFPETIGAFHSGELWVGLGPGGRPLAVLTGRIHLFEGYTVKSVTFSVRALQLLGVKTIMITNASGGIDPSYRPGDIVAIGDHINLTGENPLVGETDERLGERFLDMSQAYDPELLSLVQEVAGELGVRVHTGIYVGVRGPSFETPAEIEAFRRLGADIVGMSTVNEVIAARHGGMRVLGLSVVTNVAAAHMDDVEGEVIAKGQEVAGTLQDLLAAIIARLDQE